MPLRKEIVLAVDDDTRVLQLIRRILEENNYGVLNASNGQDALDVFSRITPDLVLLDIMMPEMDGYAVCQRIREFSKVPIIMVTAKDFKEDVIEGLVTGADDYITKPFSPKELVARVKAVLRRDKKKNKPTATFFEYDNLRIDFTIRRAFKDGVDLNLSKTEYSLLACLARNAGRLLPAEEILIKVWGKQNSKKNSLLQVNVARLRSKLNDNAYNPKYIINKSGTGYMINDGKPALKL